MAAAEVVAPAMLGCDKGGGENADGGNGGGSG